MQFLAHCHTHRITPSIVNIFYFLHCCDRCFVLMMIKNRRLCSFSSPARWLWHTTCSFLTCHEKIHIQFFPFTKNYSTLLVVVFFKYHREILPLTLHQVARCLDNSGWFAEAAILVAQSSCRSSDIIFMQPLSLSTFINLSTVSLKIPSEIEVAVYTVYTVQLLYTAVAVMLISTAGALVVITV